MFGMSGYNTYRKGKEVTKKESIAVTEEELLKLLFESGETETEALFHLTITKALGSIVIGENSYRVKENEQGTLSQNQ